MVSRNTFTYSAFTLGTVGVSALILQSVLAELVGNAQAASFFTAIVVSFCLGALATMLAIYAGAQLRSQPAIPAKEIPPRRVFVADTRSGQTGGVTTPSLTVQNQFQSQSKPMILVEDGLPRFLDTPERRRHSTVVQWIEPDPKTGQLACRQIDIQTLRRFARLHTPSRAEWSGKNETYSQCLAFFRFSGWVQPTNAKGVEWLMHYAKLSRRLTYLGDLAEISQPA
jgi:hypothetical protein